MFLELPTFGTFHRTRAGKDRQAAAKSPRFRAAAIICRLSTGFKFQRLFQPANDISWIISYHTITYLNYAYILKNSIIFRRRLVRVYGFGSPVLQIIFAFKHVFIDIPKLMIYYLQDWRIGKLENRRILPDSSTGVLLKKIVLPSVNYQNKSNID